MNKLSFAVALLASTIAGPAFAASITGTGSPAANAALAGATVVDFSTAASGTASSRTFGALTISGMTGLDNYGNAYNVTGQSLSNASGAQSVITFAFANAVSAFGFNLGAADSSWTLAAGGQSYTHAPTNGGNSQNYYGISGSNITSATLTFAGGDYVLFDNVAYTPSAATAAVPEPATWAMMMLGFGGLGHTLRRRQTAGARIRFA